MHKMISVRMAHPTALPRRVRRAHHSGLETTP